MGDDESGEGELVYLTLTDVLGLHSLIIGSSVDEAAGPQACKPGIGSTETVIDLAFGVKSADTGRNPTFRGVRMSNPSPWPRLRRGGRRVVTRTFQSTLATEQGRRRHYQANGCNHCRDRQPQDRWVTLNGDLEERACTGTCEHTTDCLLPAPSAPAGANGPVSALDIHTGHDIAVVSPSLSDRCRACFLDKLPYEFKEARKASFRELSRVRLMPQLLVQPTHRCGHGLVS
jgi:hypothetical protein